jgi:hypothetical protein
LIKQDGLDYQVILKIAKEGKQQILIGQEMAKLER